MATSSRSYHEYLAYLWTQRCPALSLACKSILCSGPGQSAYGKFFTAAYLLRRLQLLMLLQPFMGTG